MEIRLWISTLVLLMRIGHTLKSMESRLAQAVGGAAPVKQSVRYASSQLEDNFLADHPPGRVAGGAIAERYLTIAHNVEIVAFTSAIGNQFLFPPTAEHPTAATHPEFLSLINTITREEVDSFVPVRCPNAGAAKRMEALIADFRDRHDSIGGTVTCVIRNCPSGLGEPCFDKLEAKLAHAMLSIPATKGFEIGSGFGGTQLPGSIHNDPFIKSSQGPGRPRLTTKTNNSGGIQGGISNGAHIYFTVGFKPPATIGQAQKTATYDEEDGVLEAKGRHDPSVVPRAVRLDPACRALAYANVFSRYQSWRLWLRWSLWTRCWRSRPGRLRGVCYRR